MTSTQGFETPYDGDMTEANVLGDLGQACPTDYFLVSVETGARTPIAMARTPFGPDQAAWLVVSDDGIALELRAHHEVLLNEAPAQEGLLAPDDVLTSQGKSVRLEKTPMLAFLEGLTPPHKGAFWPLGLEPATVGRPGKRDNVVPLLDKTVSREQATLSYQQSRFILVPDPGSSTSTVNGRAIDGKTVLRNGDLLGFGGQILRFQSTHDTFGSGVGTIFFCDVWDYSKLFHGRGVQDVALQMREFYEAAGQAIEDNHGLVLRYIGDALLASFSETDHADSAVAAAIAMQEALVVLNEVWEARGTQPLKVGVGINSGEFALGHMGFAGYIEFGALGPDVNMAARIEKLTRDNGAKILVGESTQKLLKDQSRLRSLGSMDLKGAESMMEVFEIQA